MRDWMYSPALFLISCGLSLVAGDLAAGSETSSSKAKDFAHEAEQKTDEFFKKIFAYESEKVFYKGAPPVIGMIPLPWVEPFLDQHLLKVCQRAITLEDEWLKRTAGRLKPLMGEHEFFCGSPWFPAEQLRVTDTRIVRDDEVQIEVELRWQTNDPGGENYKLHYRVWLNWHEENGKVVLSEIRHPDSKLTDEIEAVSQDYTKALKEMK